MPVINSRGYGSQSGAPSIVTGDVFFHYDTTDPTSYSIGSPTINDLSGNGYTGSVNTGVRDLVDGVAGNVLDTDEVTTGVGIGVELGSTINTGLLHTYEMWIKPDTHVGVGGRIYYMDFRRSTTLSGGPEAVFIGDKTLSTVQFQTGQNVYSNSFTPVFGQWAHIAFTRSSGSRSFYLNGQHIGTAAGALATDWNLSRCIIGAYWWNPTAYNFDGKYAIARLYTKQLSASEINQNFEAERGKFGV